MKAYEHPGMLGCVEDTCPVCGSRFMRYGEHVYKRYVNGKMRALCSWHCCVAFEKQRDGRGRQGKSPKADPAKAIAAQLAGEGGKELSEKQKMIKAEELPCQSESQEQMDLFLWAKLQAGKYPSLALMYHIPNEGQRSAASGARLKAEGLKKGVPDICLPDARGGYFGLYIELKRKKDGRPTIEQKRYITALSDMGYAACICYGFEEARRVILAYLAERRTEVAKEERE